MDPVSAVGIAASAVQFVDLADNVFSVLFQYFKKVIKAPKDSRELRDHAYQLYDILNILQSTLETTNPRPITESTNTLNNIFIEFSKTMKDMENRVVKEGEWKKRLKWPFTEKENKIFLEKLKNYKGIFDSALSIIQRYVNVDRNYLMCQQQFTTD